MVFAKATEPTKSGGTCFSRTAVLQPSQKSSAQLSDELLCKTTHGGRGFEGCRSADERFPDFAARRAGVGGAAARIPETPGGVQIGGTLDSAPAPAAPATNQKKTAGVSVNAKTTFTSTAMARPKIVMLGVGSVGKTSISFQFVSGTFKEAYDPTIEDHFRATVTVDGKAVPIEIIDTAGQDEYVTLRDQFIQMGDGFVFVYAIDDRSSFLALEELKTSVTTIRQKEVGDIDVVVCGNKLDREEFRAVQPDDADALCREWGVPHVETSAKTNTNVKALFETIAAKVVGRMRLEATQKRLVETPPHRRKFCAVL